jgi:hypothetical protein
MLLLDPQEELMLARAAVAIVFGVLVVIGLAWLYRD